MVDTPDEIENPWVPLIRERLERFLEQTGLRLETEGEALALAWRWNELLKSTRAPLTAAQDALAHVMIDPWWNREEDPAEDIYLAGLKVLGWYEKHFETLRRFHEALAELKDPVLKMPGAFPSIGEFA